MLALSATSALAAQSSPVAPATPPSGCTYATCALRVESGFFSTRLVRGATGEPIGDALGVFGSGVDPLLTGPDSAAAFGRAYVRDTRRAAGLGFIAVAAYVVVVARTDNFRNDLDGISGTAAVATIGFAVATLPFAARARQSLSRAVWWYNAALPR
jgi:hypothetical protein